MNEDYLWDKSGEPDPQIQELEQILAPMRYEPKPLELPVVRRRNYLSLAAIAATLLVALLAGGLWIKSRKQQTPQQEIAKSVPSVVKEKETIPQPTIATNTDLPKKKPFRRRKPILTNQEREEALAAKEQVMLALRVASEKLKLAQRRTQTPPPNQIKNQHRVG